MIWDSCSLQTRQFARREIALAVGISVHPDHSDQLRLAFPEEQGQLTVVDVSEGGIGLQSPIFLPRSARLIVHVQPSRSNIAAEDIVVRTVVRRCSLVDVKPTYHIGLQFLELAAPEIRDLVKLGELLRARAAAQDAGAAGPQESPS